MNHALCAKHPYFELALDRCNQRSLIAEREVVSLRADIRSAEASMLDARKTFATELTRELARLQKLIARLERLEKRRA